MNKHPDFTNQKWRNVIREHGWPMTEISLCCNLSSWGKKCLDKWLFFITIKTSSNFLLTHGIRTAEISGPGTYPFIPGLRIKCSAFQSDQVWNPKGSTCQKSHLDQKQDLAWVFVSQPSGIAPSDDIGEFLLLVGSFDLVCQPFINRGYLFRIMCIWYLYGLAFNVFVFRYPFCFFALEKVWLWKCHLFSVLLPFRPLNELWFW